MIHKKYNKELNEMNARWYIQYVIPRVPQMTNLVANYQFIQE